MKKKLFGLFGAGGHGRESIIHTESLKNFEIYFVDDNPKLKVVNGYKVISTSEFLNLKYDKYYNVSLSDVKKRQEMVRKLSENDCQSLHLKSHTSFVYKDCQLDEGSIISSFAFIGPNVKIGKFFHINVRSSLHHDCIVGDYVTISPGVVCNGNVIIEDNVFIGAGVLIKNGNINKPLIIGKNSIVGMGTIITSDVSDNTLLYGNPNKMKKII